MKIGAKGNRRWHWNWQSAYRATSRSSIFTAGVRSATRPSILDRELKKAIDGGCRKLLLNLTELSQIDSTGVSIIVATYVSLRRLKGEVKLAASDGKSADGAGDYASAAGDSEF